MEDLEEDPTFVRAVAFVDYLMDHVSGEVTGTDASSIATRLLSACVPYLAYQYGMHTKSKSMVLAAMKKIYPLVMASGKAVVQSQATLYLVNRLVIVNNAAEAALEETEQDLCSVTEELEDLRSTHPIISN